MSANRSVVTVFEAFPVVLTVKFAVLISIEIKCF